MKNEPLTLSELREMNGVRVWAEGGDLDCWMAVHVLPSGTVAFMSPKMLADYPYLNEVGVKFYREYPEKEEV